MKNNNYKVISLYFYDDDNNDCLYSPKVFKESDYGEKYLELLNKYLKQFNLKKNHYIVFNQNFIKRTNIIDFEMISNEWSIKKINAKELSIILYLILIVDDSHRYFDMDCYLLITEDIINNALFLPTKKKSLLDRLKPFYEDFYEDNWIPKILEQSPNNLVLRKDYDGLFIALYCKEINTPIKNLLNDWELLTKENCDTYLISY